MTIKRKINDFFLGAYLVYKTSMHFFLDIIKNINIISDEMENNLMNLKSKCCEIIDVNECDTLYKVSYYRVCENCGQKEKGLKERHFYSVLKNGSTMDIDNWHCPHCNHLNITEINNIEN